MQTYIVGGAVRDRLLGLPVKDRDFVVVGATPDDMLARGFRPVGKDFPVFLHPVTHEEYALARTERKTAPGYRGFVFHTDPSVTLEDDLIRRDLTINAIACAEDGRLIDPHGGQRDIEARVLRHVSDAFAEDPVRILRLARFAARFADFRIAGETLALCRRMVAEGEVDALVAERVWQEIAKGLLAPAPWRMFEVLLDCGALARLMPELVPAMALPDPLGVLRSTGPADDLAVRWASLWLPARDRGEGAAAAAERLKVPNDCRELAATALRESAALAEAGTMGPDALLALLERCDALRRPARFERLLRLAALAHGNPQAVTRCRLALAEAAQVDAGAIARRETDRARIPVAVRAARLAAITQALS
ncbi:MAG: multifunctional CCA tRNA nucleotidyl transferase/2'3'-cyclic phosphodiesterase/2'nucleotidase/phosphatase [Rhodocyclaceae bacterium]|nr:multifunctional CCA tRNA nucleotidyl transferase/2'3'-cyclic phosphodiesterase/2'nucleotidase/phosphatase [Rhodocyclaceae bacterium]